MSGQPVRNFTRVAVAIVVAAIVISAAALSYSSFERTVTKTVSTGSDITSISTSVGTSVSTSTVTTTSTLVSTKTVTSDCPDSKITNLEGHVLSTNSTIDCNLGITLELDAGYDVTTGQNETVYVSLTNDLPVARDVNYTGLPTLPHGLDLSYSASYDYLLPLQPPCALPSDPGYEPAFFAVYNGSGAPVQLSDSPPPALACISDQSASYHSFNASQTIAETLSIGGYWTSPNTGEPWVNATYSHFSPGNYTIVAFDPWQQLTELNFTVTSPAVSPGEVAVVIPSGASSNTELNFEPASIHVVLGVNNTVLFTNDDTSVAQVGSTSWPANASGFETGILNPGQNGPITLTVPGVYNYTDILRPVWLKGAIVVEPLPLQLRVSLNATSIRTGGGIQAEISLSNPLDVNVSVSPNYETDNSTILSWNAHDFLCGGLAASNPTWSLAGYALFQGHYTSGNLSSAGSPLNLVAPLAIGCPAMPNPNLVVFTPHGSSTVASFSNSSLPVIVGRSSMNTNTGACVLTSGYYNCNGTALAGYWTGPPGGAFNPENATTDSPYFHYFPPGQYTLVVEDAWGQIYYAYFEVVS